MFSFFPFNTQSIQFLLAFGFYARCIGNKNMPTLLNSKNSCANARFTSAKNDHIFRFLTHYLNFKVTMVTTANSTATIQKRATILASCMPFF